MGAEFILPGNTVVEATAERLGLGLWAKGMAYGRREPRGTDEPVSEDDLRAAAGTIESALSAGERGSAAGLLDRLDLRPAVREAVRARVEVSAAASATEVAAGELAGLAAFSDIPSHGVAGGNQGLALGLAAPLAGDVHLETPVRALVWSEDGVVLRTDDDEIVADAAVVAVPASVMDAIAFAPALPQRTQAAIARVPYGHAAKLFTPLRAPRGRAQSCPSPSATGRGRRVRARRSSPSSTRSPVRAPRSTASAWPRARNAGWTRSPGCAPTWISRRAARCSRPGPTTHGPAPPTPSTAPTSATRR